MFTKTQTEPTQLVLAIDGVLNEMATTSSSSKEYAAMADQLVKLMKLKEDISSKKTISSDTLALIAGNLAGIVLILTHEHAHVITSKALSFVMKLR